MGIRIPLSIKSDGVEVRRDFVLFCLFSFLRKTLTLHISYFSSSRISYDVIRRKKLISKMSIPVLSSVPPSVVSTSKSGANLDFFFTPPETVVDNFADLSHSKPSRINRVLKLLNKKKCW